MSHSLGTSEWALVLFLPAWRGPWGLGEKQPSLDSLPGWLCEASLVPTLSGPWISPSVGEVLWTSETSDFGTRGATSLGPTPAPDPSSLFLPSGAPGPGTRPDLPGMQQSAVPETEEGGSKGQGRRAQSPTLPQRVWGLEYSWKETRSWGRAGEAGRWKRMAGGASLKRRGGRNVFWDRGIVPYPKSSQERLTVRFID